MSEEKKDVINTANEESVIPSDKQEPTPNQEAAGSPQKAPAQIDGSELKSQEKSDYVFDGNWQKLKEDHPELAKYATGVRRYLTKESEKISHSKDKIDRYTQLETDPELQEFITWKKTRRDPFQQPANYAAAPDSYDASDVDPGVKKMLAEREQLYAQKLNSLELRVKQIDKANEIEAFADAHPDFWKLHQLGLLRPQIESIVDTGKGTIADAYNKASENYQQLIDQVRFEDKTIIDKKKNATSVKPGAAGEAEVEYVNSDRDLMQRAFDLAAAGKRRTLKVKNKK